MIVDWNAIKSDYIAGGTTYKDLAAKYGVSESTLRKTGAKEHWAELRNKTGTKTEQKISDAISDQQAQEAVSAAKLINDSAQNLLEKIYKATQAEVMLTRDMIDYAKALKVLKEVAGVKSELDIKEQNARIANLEKQSKEESDGDRTYTVVIGNAKDYIG